MCESDQNVCESDKNMYESDQNVCESDQIVCESDQNVCESDNNTLFLGAAHQNTGPTRRKVLLATETQRKMENIDDIYFHTDLEEILE